MNKISSLEMAGVIIIGAVILYCIIKVVSKIVAKEFKK
jgi:hypothetical protein